MWSSFYTRYRNYFHYASLRRKEKSASLPLSYWESLKDKLALHSSKADVLLPAQRLVKSKGKSVKAEAVRRLIRNDIIGVWTLDRMTIDLLWKELIRHRPMTIAECGCGISTLLIAQYLKQVQPEGVCLSFEQSGSEIKRVGDRLAAAGLGKRVRFLDTPLNPEGEYDFNAGQIHQVLEGRKLDWIIIDGPGGPDKCRENTLPMLMQYTAPQCRWWLDDALRDGEMEFLRDWEKIPGVMIDGIIPVGKGLGTGSITYSPTTEARL